MATKELGRLELIDHDNFRTAMQIRAACYLNDYKNILPPEMIEAYDFEEDVLALSDWFFEATEDVRRGFIYYADNVPVGMVIGSMGELENQSGAVEVNYLFVSEHARGHQVGKRLLVAISALYSRFKFTSLHLYNWRGLKSNQFYRHIGGEVIQTVVQSPGGKALETDIFRWSIADLLLKMPITRIHWFSGTGGSEWAAELLAESLRKKGEICLLQSMAQYLFESEQIPLDSSNLSLLREVFVYPVHAFDAPKIVYDYINALGASREIGVRTSVISVSGGGEVWPNTACRARVIETLQKLGYAVTYEEMLVLPANMLIQTSTDLNTYLMKALPQKINYIAEDLHADVQKKTRVPLSKGLLLQLSDMEKKYAKSSNSHFTINDKCTRCGWCAQACPTKNIDLSEGRPTFQNKCELCLKCLYGCPYKAIEAPKFSKYLLPRYNLNQMKLQAKRVPKTPVEGCCKGLMYIGIKRYLE